MSRPPTDYVEVHQRMAEFFERFPEGSLVMDPPTVIDVAGQSYMLGQARAYRSPDDAAPGVGTAWEPVPGTTNFTRGSEPQNLETSCWGRAMAALGIATKKGIASAHEVRMARGREAPVTPTDDGLALVAAATTEDELRALWSHQELHAAILARRAELA